MSGVRRYDSMGFEYEQGRWVRWADYDALLRERDALRAALESALDDITHNGFVKQYTEGAMRDALASVPA